MAATIIISVVIAAVLGLVIYKMIRDKKQGKTACGCGCKDCAMSGVCHSKD